MIGVYVQNVMSLPAGTVVRFREPTAWETYRWRIVGFVALCAAEALLIVALLVQGEDVGADLRATSVALAPVGVD